MIWIRNLATYWPLVMVASGLGLGCRFDTTPVIGPIAGTGVAMDDTRGVEELPSPTGGSFAAPEAPKTAAAAPQAAQPAAPGLPVDAGVLVTPPPPTAPSGGMPAPARLPDPVNLPVAEPPHCAGMGSYGLQITADLAWDSSNGLTLAGRGPAEIYAKLDVQELAADGGAFHATARVCGIVFPPSSSPLSCGPRQLRFAQELWDHRAIPPWSVDGQYTCAADACTLQLASSPYDLGVGSAPSLHFPDDDGDGSPGVTVDVAVPPNDSANPSCGAWLGWGASAASESAGSLRIGLHAQLQAALRLAADCSITHATAALEAFELQAADCAPSTSVWGAGQAQTGAAGSPSASASCSPEQRTALAESLPRYRVLNLNEVPAAAAVPRDSSPSAGTALRAVRFIPGGAATCEQVRKAMY